MDLELPVRRHLPHMKPGWVDDGSRYFVTINCLRRGVDVLCRQEVARALCESVAVYERLDHWHMWLLMIMPDHVHLIAAFNWQRGLQRTIAAWKGYHAKQWGIEWQTGFFEHRLRDDAEFVEKASYIRMNPVRKGLVQDPPQWKYLWQRSGA